MLFLGCTLIGLFYSSQVYLLTSYKKVPYTWKRSIAATLPDTYLWAVLAIIIIWLSTRYRFGRNSWRQALLIHMPASLLMAGLHLLIAVSIIPVFQQVKEHPWWWATMKYNFVSVFHWNVLIYWTIVACNHAIHYYRSYREHEIRTSHLEAQLAQAQLQALKMQLHPHFLFNTLHSVSALIHKNPDAADRMITRLGDFLRTTLENAGTQEITLQKEIEFINCYLEIEQIRFQDRLRVILDIDPEALDALVPNLLWQPVLENAIRHGIAVRSELGCIEIGARKEGGRLRVSIRDNGPGIPGGSKVGGVPNEGIGLANTRARLRQLYGENHSFELRNGTPGGLEVILEIPFKHSVERSVATPGPATAA
jgi:hypothetical protein